MAKHEIQPLLARMDRWLAETRPDYYACLLSGATDTDLDAFEAQFSLKLPVAFLQLYRWRNGQDPMPSDSLFLTSSPRDCGGNSPDLRRRSLGLRQRKAVRVRPLFR